MCQQKRHSAISYLRGFNEEEFGDISTLRSERDRSSSICQEDEIVGNLSAEVSSQFALSEPHLNACNSILEVSRATIEFSLVFVM